VAGIAALSKSLLTPAQKKKSGTMSGVVALAGYVDALIINRWFSAYCQSI